jgi:hypothetical protein
VPKWLAPFQSPTQILINDCRPEIKTLYGRYAGIVLVPTRGFRSKTTIVAFHRVSDHLPEDGLTCSSEKLQAFCKFFRKYFRVLPLAEQIAGCHAGVDLGGALSITFDEGYLDNFEVAAPILSKIGLSDCPPHSLWPQGSQVCKALHLGISSCLFSPGG